MNKFHLNLLLAVLMFSTLNVSVAQTQTGADYLDKAYEAFSNGKSLEAEKYLVLGLRAEKNNTELSMELGRLYRRQQRFEKATTLFSQMVAKQPSNSAIWVELGRTYQAMSNISEADKAYAQAYSKGQNNPETLQDVAGYYQWKGDTATATAIDNNRENIYRLQQAKESEEANLTNNVTALEANQ